MSTLQGFIIYFGVQWDYNIELQPSGSTITTTNGCRIISIVDFRISLERHLKGLKVNLMCSNNNEW